MGTRKSAQLLKRAVKIIPGGVNSPVRAFKAVGGGPLFISRARARRYTTRTITITSITSVPGPMILSSYPPKVTSALKKALDRGTSYGAPTELEVTLAGLTLKAFPSMIWSGS